MKHLEDEDRDFLSFLVSLDRFEFKMLLNSMNDSDARRLMFLLQLAKDEKFDEIMEESGTPDADDLVNYIKNTLD
jgi:hypothetical protein